MLKEGDKAPGFSVKADDGRTISLADYLGRDVILYFYPKAHTSGCTHEAVDFRNAMPQFEAANAVVLGCSGDSIEAQSSFKDKHKLNFPLLADTDFEVIEAYGARRMKSFFGKSFLGIVRTTLWIGRDGTVRKIWNRVTPTGHSAEVLAAIQEGSAELERSAANAS
jgi:peroxiredoxin Q/BCP